MLGRLNLNFDFLQSELAQTIIGLLLLGVAAVVTWQVPEVAWLREPSGILILGKFISPAIVAILEQMLAAYRTGLTLSERAQLSSEQRAQLAFAVQNANKETYG